MASHSYQTLGFNLLQERGSNEIIKKSQAYLVNPGGRRRRRIPESFFSLKLEQQHLKPLKLSSVSSSYDRYWQHESVKKRDNPKKIRERRETEDLYRRNKLQACESLISLMIGSEQHRQTTLLSLKKSSRDISELLTRLSIGFAGTGIAVFFSVASSRGVPFCENKFFDIALSFSLVLLSWAVSRLKKAIVDVKRKAIKEEEEESKNIRVQRRIKEVYITAATVFAMIVLRFGF